MQIKTVYMKSLAPGLVVKEANKVIWKWSTESRAIEYKRSVVISYYDGNETQNRSKSKMKIEKFISHNQAWYDTDV